ncbi:MAG: SRPBCC family protein, partial [bacterium]
FTVKQSPTEVFAAVANPRAWWSEGIKGTTNALGGVFTYHYGKVHRVKMEISEYVPGERITWTVLNNHFSFTVDKTEWKGTQIVFEIAKKGSGSELRFTHRGLVPEYECYDVCRTAWGSCIGGSLKSLIATGKGRPNPMEGVAR